MALNIGDTAPDLELPAQDGAMVRLSRYRGQKPVVLFFYPKDHTPICTKEACSFRDSYADFVDAGAEVIGINQDPPGSHKTFAEKNSLPFPLLSDANLEARKLYGIKVSFGFMPERITFVIDKAGVIRHVYSSQLMASRHARKALEAVRQLAKEQEQP